MEATGKYRDMPFQGGTMRLLNQRCRAWTHAYEYPPAPGGTLASAGCGVFAVAHVAQRMAGLRLDVEELADFSVANGGRGDDGTDRPALLDALSRAGRAAQYGFAYLGEGLVNDPEQLWAVMTAGGCALCNLRVGHIVALLDWRLADGERQLLAVDSYSESAHEKVRPFVRECVPGSEICAQVRNDAGLVVGQTIQYAMYWVPLSLPRDVNFLWRLPGAQAGARA